jgi:adenylosuccinate synthase
MKYNIFNFFRLALTKLDILDGLSEIKIAVGYKHNGEKLESFPGLRFCEFGLFLREGLC